MIGRGVQLDRATTPAPPAPGVGARLPPIPGQPAAQQGRPCRPWSAPRPSRPRPRLSPPVATDGRERPRRSHPPPLNRWPSVGAVSEQTRDRISHPGPTVPLRWLAASSVAGDDDRGSSRARRAAGKPVARSVAPELISIAVAATTQTPFAVPIVVLHAAGRGCRSSCSNPTTSGNRRQRLKADTREAIEAQALPGRMKATWRSTTGGTRSRDAPSQQYRGRDRALATARRGSFEPG